MSYKSPIIVEILQAREVFMRPEDKIPLDGGPITRRPTHAPPCVLFIPTSRFDEFVGSLPDDCQGEWQSKTMFYGMHVFLAMPLTPKSGNAPIVVA